MKKIYYRLILIIFLCLAFYANAGVFAYENKMPIEDELLQLDYFKNNFQKSSVEEKTPITDELLNPNLYKFSTILELSTPPSTIFPSISLSL